MSTRAIEIPRDADPAPPTPSATAPAERVATAAPAAGGHAAPAAPAARQGATRAGLAWAFLPSLVAAAALAVHWYVPNRQKTETTGLYPRLLLGAIVAGLLLGLTQRLWRHAPVSIRRPLRLPHAILSNVLHWCVANAAILAAGIALVCAWDLITLKLALMPLPYFPGPDAVFQTLVDDWASAHGGQPGLAECMAHSLLLLMSGYLLGCALGVTFGVLIGWYPGARRWGMPVMKLVGPIPATAFIPLSLMIFPSARMSATALVALAVWFPVTMLTLSGVSNVRASYLDVARTLGAGQRYLIFRVAIPAALPNIFVGLFMGLGASFLTLIVAEAVGVQAGLGWYIDWARAYSDYRKVYAAIIIMAVYFSTIMTLLFKLRDWVLVWQKGVIKW
jgi:NitT/TauT family transport system permease protein